MNPSYLTVNSINISSDNIKYPNNSIDTSGRINERIDNKLITNTFNYYVTDFNTETINLNKTIKFTQNQDIYTLYEKNASSQFVQFNPQIGAIVFNLGDKFKYTFNGLTSGNNQIWLKNDYLSMTNDDENNPSYKTVNYITKDIQSINYNNYNQNNVTLATKAYVDESKGNYHVSTISTSAPSTGNNGDIILLKENDNLTLKIYNGQNWNNYDVAIGSICIVEDNMDIYIRLTDINNHQVWQYTEINISEVENITHFYPELIEYNESDTTNVCELYKPTYSIINSKFIIKPDDSYNIDVNKCYTYIPTGNTLLTLYEYNLPIDYNFSDLSELVENNLYRPIDNVSDSNFVVYPGGSHNLSLNTVYLYYKNSSNLYYFKRCSLNTYDFSFNFTVNNKYISYNEINNPAFITNEINKNKIYLCTNATITQGENMSFTFTKIEPINKQIVHCLTNGQQLIYYKNSNNDERWTTLGVGKIDENRSTGEIFNCYTGDDKNIASGDYSHAEGRQTTASGDYSHAEGGGTTALGDISHAEGVQTIASGDISHAEGIGTTASGDYSHAEGYKTTASGGCSHSSGSNTVAYNDNMFVVGEYNNPGQKSEYDGKLFVVGNGTKTNDQEITTSDAFVVKNTGECNINGNCIISGTTSLTSGTISNTPSNSTDIVNKGWVDKSKGNYHVSTISTSTPSTGNIGDIILLQENDNLTLKIYDGENWNNYDVAIGSICIVEDNMDIYIRLTDINNHQVWQYTEINISEVENITHFYPQLIENNDSDTTSACNLYKPTDSIYNSKFIIKPGDSYNIDYNKYYTYIPTGNTLLTLYKYNLPIKYDFSDLSGLVENNLYIPINDITDDNIIVNPGGSHDLYLNNIYLLYFINSSNLYYFKRCSLSTYDFSFNFTENKKYISYNEINNPAFITNEINKNKIYLCTNATITPGGNMSFTFTEIEPINKQIVHCLSNGHQLIYYKDSNNNEIWTTLGVGKIDENRLTGEIFNCYTGDERNIASGDYSHAEGYTTTASSYNSHAEGRETTASGNSSHAEGDQTTASGDYSHAEGDQTTASGDSSHAEGYNTTASGFSSHAEGFNTIASGDYSHAEGGNTTASNYYSHAEGRFSIASNFYSHAEGCSTIASGRHSHTEGINTEASGESSHAEGDWTIASGNYSHASGSNTVAYNHGMFVIGKYNIPGQISSNDGKLFVVGNGTYSSTSDAFIVKDTGECNINGSCIINKDFIIKGGTHTVGSSNVTDQLIMKQYEFTAGNPYVIYSEYTGIEMFMGGTNYTRAKCGYQLQTDNSNNGVINVKSSNINITSATSITGNTTITGNCSISGTTTLSSGTISNTPSNSTDIINKSYFDNNSVGKKETGEIFNSYSGTDKNTASGSYSHAEGSKTTASGNYSHAEGETTTASGVSSHAGGYYTVANTNSMTAIGRFNKYNPTQTKSTIDRLFVIGNGTADNSRTDAFVVQNNGNCTINGNLYMGNQNYIYFPVTDNTINHYIRSSGNYFQMVTNKIIEISNNNSFSNATIGIRLDSTNNNNINIKGYIDSDIDITNRKYIQLSREKGSDQYFRIYQYNNTAGPFLINAPKNSIEMICGAQNFTDPPAGIRLTLSSSTTGYIQLKSKDYIELITPSCNITSNTTITGNLNINYTSGGNHTFFLNCLKSDDTTRKLKIDCYKNTSKYFVICANDYIDLFYTTNIDSDTITSNSNKGFRFKSSYIEQYGTVVPINNANNVSNQTITHNMPIFDDISNYQLGMPAFIANENKSYYLQEIEGDNCYEYVEITNDLQNHAIDCIPKIQLTDNGKFIGVITGIYNTNEPYIEKAVNASAELHINCPTAQVSTHGDYIFKVNDNTAEHQTTSGSMKHYEVGDNILYDGTIIDPNTPLTYNLTHNCVGSITCIPSNNTNYVSVFKF